MNQEANEMRGEDNKQEAMFSYVSPEKRFNADVMAASVSNETTAGD